MSTSRIKARVDVFQVNKKHLQKQFFSTIDGLPERQAARLREGWAGAFRRDYFSRIDEQPYAVLYSKVDSRPNVPVNVLVGLEALKSGFNWSDEEMYDAFCFDLQVRFALGYHNLGEGQFDLRTVYNFRHRLAEHMQASGENLIEKSFEKATDEQIAFFKLKSDKVRMDSTMIASNIRNMSRLHLLVEVIQRVYRMLAEGDRSVYAEAFAPYVKGNATQYVYRVKGEDGADHMQRIGELMRELLEKLAGAYREDATYLMLQRVFTEHFLIEQDRLRLKAGKELSSESLTSPDDMEATFRTKNNRSYKGYVENVTETCNPENPLQLIAKVQTKPNVANDDDMLTEAVPSLKERLGIDEMHTDGGYNSDESYKVLRENGIEHVQTAIRGHSPHKHIGLDKFDIATSLAGTPDPADSAADENCHPANEREAVITSPTGESCNPANEREIDATCAADEACNPANEAEVSGTSRADDICDMAKEREADSTAPAGDGCHLESEREVGATCLTNEACNLAKESEVGGGSRTEIGCNSAKRTPVRITCPGGQTVTVERAKSKTDYQRFRAHFDTAKCASCGFAESCPAQEMKSKPQRTLSFDEHDAEIAQRRRRIVQDRLNGSNLRVTVESTIASLKRPFCYGKLPVRGLFRVATVLIGVAVMANIRRIHRYVAKMEARMKLTTAAAS